MSSPAAQTWLGRTSGSSAVCLTHFFAPHIQSACPCTVKWENMRPSLSEFDLRSTYKTDVTLAKMSKAECSKAGKALVKNGSSSAGKKLAHCRWHKGQKPTTKKPVTKKPQAAPARKSRRLAGLAAETVRQPEPSKKPRKKGKKKKVGTAGDSGG